MLRWLTAVLACAAAAQTTDAFLANWQKAQTRESPDEQAVYYARAIAAWDVSDGTALLADARFRLGQADYELDLATAAAAQLTAALKLDPGIGQAYLARGRAWVRKRRWAAAARDLSAYCRLKPGDEEGWLELGRVEDAAGRLRSAESAFSRAAAAADGSDPRPSWARAAALSRRGRCAQALRLLAGSSSLSEAALAARARCEARDGGLRRALVDYERALAGYDRRLLALRRSRAAPVDISLLAAEAAAVRAERDRLIPPPLRRKPRSSHGRAGDRIYAD